MKLTLIYSSIFLAFLSLPAYANTLEELRDPGDPVFQLLNSGQLDSAMTIVNELLKKDSLSFKHHIHKFQIYRNKRKRKSLLRQANKNYDLFFESVSPSKQALLLLHLSHATFRRGKNEESRDWLEQAKKLISKQNLQSKHLKAYQHFVQGIVYSHFFSMADERVEANYLKSVSLFQSLKTPDPYMIGQTLKLLGIIYKQGADFENALNYFQKEIEVYEQNYSGDASYDLGGAYYNKANIYYELMDYKNSIDYYLVAYEHWKHFMKPSGTYMRYLTEMLGELYWEQDQKEKALFFFNLSVEGKEKANDPNLEKPITADSLLGENRYKEALDIYEDALQFRTDLYGTKHAMTGACQNFIARAWLQKGEPEKALDAYQVALQMLVLNFEDSLTSINPEISTGVISEQYLLESLAGKANTITAIYQKNKTQADLKLAFETTIKAIELLNKMRKSPLADRSRMFWTRKYFSLFENALALAFELYPNSEDFAEIAFSVMEESKTMLLQNALRTEQELRFLNVPQTIVAKEKALRKTINEYLIRIDNEESLCDKAQTKKIDLWNKELLNQKLLYNNFLEEIRQDFPNFYKLKFSHKSLQRKEVQSQLLTDSSSALLEWFEGEKHIYGLLMTKERTLHFRIVNDSLFQSKLNEFIQSLYQFEKSLVVPQLQLNKFIQQSSYIYEKLMAPVVEALPQTISQLYIIPDQHLFYLPFESLVTSSTATTDSDFRALPYLLHRFHISYSQSASILSFSQNAKQSSYQYNYVGFAPDQFTVENNTLNSLNWNREEVQTAANKWDGQSFKNELATKNKFIELAGKSQIQHLATHALIDNENPMLSRILFQRNGKEEGILNTYELYALPLIAELIVLNACNTGVGAWERGEGIMSLERAFLYAGCPSLLTSTWSIDDRATAELTSYFFDFLHEGKPKSEALSLAKRKFLAEADPSLGHPFFWAGLRLTGNTNAIAIQKSGKKKWLILFGVLIMVGVFLGWHKS